MRSKKKKERRRSKEEEEKDPTKTWGKQNTNALTSIGFDCSKQDLWVSGKEEGGRRREIREEIRGEKGKKREK